MHVKSIQEIFSGENETAISAIVQKLSASDFNVNARDLNFTESWPQINERSSVMVLAFGEPSDAVRDIWAGVIQDVVPSITFPGRFRIYVDCFKKIGLHNRRLVSDKDFYAKGGGGGSRIIIENTSPSANRSANRQAPVGEMEQRLIWVRKNHRQFRDPVWQHWEGCCAVSDSECNGLLIASHIYPWAKGTKFEKTDVNNGLLLSVPLDRLFDRGLISFAEDGTMLTKDHLSADTKKVFGLTKSVARIAHINKVTEEMKAYLARHRKLHVF